MNDQTKKCSYCAEVINSEAIKCKYCKTALNKKVELADNKPKEGFFLQTMNLGCQIGCGAILYLLY